MNSWEETRLNIQRELWCMQRVRHKRRLDKRKTSDVLQDEFIYEWVGVLSSISISCVVVLQVRNAAPTISNEKGNSPKHT